MNSPTTIADLARVPRPRRATTSIHALAMATRERDRKLLARGRQAVIWTNPQRRPSLMPDALYQVTADYFGVGEK